MDPIINDGQARRIAAEWHGGQWTALYSLASSGHIDRDRLRTEISREVQTLDHGYPRRDLLALDRYVRGRGDTSAIPGWHRLWDETPVRLDQTCFFAGR